MRYWLKSIRESKNLTVQQVADLAGISQGYLTTLENGQRGGKLPVETAKRIASALGFDWTEFYARDEALDGGEGNAVQGIL